MQTSNQVSKVLSDMESDIGTGTIEEMIEYFNKEKYQDVAAS